MIKNTFRFWLMATVVLATVYLISNPTMASKMGSQASQIWQVVISKVVKIPELLATITPAEQEELANREQTVNPIGTGWASWNNHSSNELTQKKKQFTKKMRR